MPKPASVKPRRDLEARNAAPTRTLHETFQDTLRECFDSTLRNVLGPSVGREINNLLAMKGIQPSEIPAKFDQVVQVLNEAFGAGARELVRQTVITLYAEYSVKPSFTVDNSPIDQIGLLWDKVLFHGLEPKHIHGMEAASHRK